MKKQDISELSITAIDINRRVSFFFYMVKIIYQMTPIVCHQLQSTIVILNYSLFIKPTNLLIYIHFDISD